MAIKMQFVCDMLVDQGRRVGGDRVGHKCSNPAIMVLGAEPEGMEGALICRDCHEILLTKPGRLTLSACRGKVYQEAVIKAVVKDMVG